MARQAPVYHPGPIDQTVLVCQQTHRSRAVWSDPNFDAVVQFARYDVVTRDIPEARDRRVVEYLRQAGLYGVSHLTTILVDHGLISALLERWRPEVHAFHIPFGEVGITLQDVEVLFGLKVDGLPVTGYDRGSAEGWQALCTELLGFTPGLESIKGSKIMSAAIPEVPELTDVSTDEEVQIATRLKLFHLLGGFFFSETTKRDVKLYLLPFLRDFESCGNYSWGSAVLAYLYRALCRGADYNASTVCGCMVLLQLWAWERLPMVRPQGVLPVEQLGDLPLGARWVCSHGYLNVTSHVVRAYRDQLDHTFEHNFVFTPYTGVMPILPGYCKAGARMWTAEVPLIFYFIVEHYFPDRFCRQFGGFQDVPRPVQYRKDLHVTDGRAGQKIVNWGEKHFNDLAAWYNWEQHVIQMQEPLGELNVTAGYISWYYRIGRRQIGNPAHVQHDGYQQQSGSYNELICEVHRLSLRGRRSLDNLDEDNDEALKEITERMEQLVASSPFAYLSHIPAEILNSDHNPDEAYQGRRRRRRDLRREREH